MFKIAICDDEPSIVEQLERMILEYPKQICVSTTKYYSGEQLCKDIDNGKKWYYVKKMDTINRDFLISYPSSVCSITFHRQ